MLGLQGTGEFLNQNVTLYKCKVSVSSCISVQGECQEELSQVFANPLKLHNSSNKKELGLWAGPGLPG